MLLPDTRPAMPVGIRPLPRSTEIVASSVRLLASTRLVTATGRYSVKLPVNMVPGVEPEHWSWMSPRRSVKPSALTCKGVAVTLHRAVDDGDCAHEAVIQRGSKQTYSK